MVTTVEIFHVRGVAVFVRDCEVSLAMLNGGAGSDTAFLNVARSSVTATALAGVAGCLLLTALPQQLGRALKFVFPFSRFAV